MDEYTQKRGRIYTKVWTNIHIIRGQIYTIRGESVVCSPRIWYDLSNGEVNICKAI